MRALARQAAAVFGSLFLVSSNVCAVTYVWDGGGADNNWSAGDNWSPNGSAAVSASDTTVRLDGIVRTSPIQNIASPFLLNRLDIYNGPSSTPTGKAAFVLGGGPLLVVTNGAVHPRFFSNREATSSITNDITIPAGTTLYLEIGTWGISLKGVLSGGGSIDKLQNAGGLDLNNGANSFSGGLMVRAANDDWCKVNVNASGAMGTGEVSLYGGTLVTNKANPGGLCFFNTTTHTNSINLYTNSPIFVAMPSGSASVTLNGPLDLNTFTLYLRGGGNGTINGVVSEGTNSAVTKIDAGTWTLSGANTFTGRLTVGNGTLKLGAANALNPAVPITVTHGTFDINGYSPTVSQLSDGAATIGTRIVNSAAAATLTVNQSGDTRFDGRLTGALRLVKAGTGALTLSNNLSTTTGAITVSNGTLIVALAASLGNSTNVTVAGGTLDLQAVNTILDRATVSVENGAKLKIATGVTEIVGKLVLGGVEQTGGGSWGASGSGATHIDDTYFTAGSLGTIVVVGGSATWDGGDAGNTLFSTPANWDGDAAPAFDGSMYATFATGGITATVDTVVSLYGITMNSDTNFVLANGAGALTLGAAGLAVKLPSPFPRTYELAEDVTFVENQVWSVTNNSLSNATLVVTGSLSDGNGSYGLTKWGNGTLVLTGDNTYDGVTTVKTGGIVRITSGTAFGSTNGATIVEDGGLVEMSGGITVAEPIALYGDSSTSHQGVLRSNGGSNILSGLIINGSRIRCNSGSLDIVGGATGGQFVLAAAGNTMIRVSEKPIQIGGATFYAHTDSLVILDVTNNVWSQLEVSGNILRTDRENALPPTSTLTLGPNTYGGVNLNGKNQSVGQLVCTYTTAGTRIVYSTAPAMLTVTQNVNSTFNGSITGAVSVVKTGSGALTLSSMNTLYGSVAVSNGTLLVSATGSLGANCPLVCLGGTGTLTLSNSVAIADAATVTMPAEGVSTAKINLAGGVNESVRYLYFGAKQARAGKYGSTASPAGIQDNDHFSGAGILTVLRDNYGTVIKVQ